MYKYELGTKFKLTKDIKIPIYDYDTEEVVDEMILTKGTIFEIDSSGMSSGLKEVYYFANFENEMFGEISHSFYQSELDEFEIIN